MLDRVTTLYLATRNAHKVEEIRGLLGNGLRYLTLRDLPDAPAVEENGETFRDNARLKAEAVAAWLLARGSFDPAAPAAVLADDSGLEVDALGGAPGTQSARFASADFGLPGNAPDGANNAKLLRLLAAVPPDQRTARFRCALAFTWVRPGLPGESFEGACEGRIGLLPRGRHGFGYDPLFIPEGFAESFAELGEDTKNRISHRSRALAQLRTWLGARR